ncbi:MAG: methylmalonyl Co-A mutase-associated GTPase MeaB, partial [Acidimicrobiia bacterium]
GGAHVVGLTGPPGAGKSTLVNALIAELRSRDATVAVVAVDPSSPFSGGAILGDRVRMSEHATDPDVFVRSLASRGHLGGLSRTTARVVDVLDAAGYDAVLVETVGTGQAEIDIMHLAQSVVVVCAPGLGDEIQAVKAGILEIADILVVNKADLDLADRAERQLRDAVGPADTKGWVTPILQTVATEGGGVPKLAGTIADHYAGLEEATRSGAAVLRARQQLAAAAAELVAGAISADTDPVLEQLAAAVAEGSLALDAAAKQAARRVIET